MLSLSYESYLKVLEKPSFAEFIPLIDECVRRLPTCIDDMNQRRNFIRKQLTTVSSLSLNDDDDLLFISPSSVFMRTWDIFALLFATYYAITIPIGMAAFCILLNILMLLNIGKDSYSYITSKWIVISISWLIDIFFAVDIFIRERYIVPIELASDEHFNVNSLKTKTVTDMFRSKRTYYIDILSIIPFDMISIYFIRWEYVYFARSNKLLRFLHLKSYIESIETLLSNRLGYEALYALRLFYHFVFLFYCTSLFGMIFYMFSILQPDFPYTYYTLYYPYLGFALIL